MSYTVWVRNDPSTITENAGPEAVMWLILEDKCVYFMSDGRVGVTREEKHKLNDGQSLGYLWERLL